MRIRGLTVLSVAGLLLVAAGCESRTRQEQEEAALQAANARIDQLQDEMGDLRSTVNNLRYETVTAEPTRSENELTLRPVEAAESASPPAAAPQTRRERLSAIASRTRPVVAGSTGRATGSRPTTKKGKKHIRVSASIADVQRALKAAGHSPGTVDGKIGPKTIAAIRSFQRQFGLSADGIVGSRTWDRLGPFLSGAPMK